MSVQSLKRVMQAPPDPKRRRVDVSDAREDLTAIPPSVKELELRARLSASEKRERELFETLEQVSSYFAAPTASFLPTADTPIPPSLQPLLSSLQQRISSLQRENDRLRAATKTDEPSRIALLEAENAKLADMLSSGRVAALEAGLKDVDESSRQMILALEADCDELVELVRKLRNSQAEVTGPPLAALEKGKAEAIRRSASPSDKRRSRRSPSSPKRSRDRSPERQSAQRRPSLPASSSGRAPSDRHRRDERSRVDQRERSDRESRRRKHETRTPKEARDRDDQHDSRHERKRGEDPRQRDETRSSHAERSAIRANGSVQRTPTPPPRHGSRGISIRGLANGSRNR